MENQTQQIINNFYGDYGQFKLTVFAVDKKSDFTGKVGEDVYVSLSYSEFENKICKFYLGNDDGIIINGTICEMQYKNREASVKIKLPTDTDGLFFFHFELEENGSLLFLSPSGITDSFCVEWQFLVAQDKYPQCHGFNGGAIYHVFVDRFNKGGSCPLRNDAILLDWDKDTPEFAEKTGDFLRNNTFFGGTLWGVADKLDYIASLGIDLVYLSPVFTAYSNHKYDTGDYMTVDPMFGGDEALQAVIDGCHKRNMKVILDGVFNHVGDDSVYFDIKNKYGGAYFNPDSPYRKWFNIDDDGGYECWWGIKNLPKVIKCREFRDFITKTVIPKYMNMGIDGWRLDVVDEYPQDFLEEITEATKKINPNAYILGEVWEDASNKTAYGERKKYLCGTSLDGVMNYPFRNAVIDFVMTGDTEFITQTVSQLVSHYPPQKLFDSMNMLGTHDTERIMTVLGGVSADGLSNSELSHTFMTDGEYSLAKNRFINAYTLLACLPGKTAVYYGDEAGMQGYSDPFNRRPFIWGKQDSEITQAVTQINKIKMLNLPLSHGDFAPVFVKDGIFAFKRIYSGNTVCCISNMTDEPFGLKKQEISLADDCYVSNVPPKTTMIFKEDVL